MTSYLDIVADLARALADAGYTLESTASVDLWMQAWPSTARGHAGGASGQTVTTGSVVVVIGVTHRGDEASGKPVALVYSGGRLLHRVTPAAAERAIAARRVPAAGGVWP